MLLEFNGNLIIKVNFCNMKKLIILLALALMPVFSFGASKSTWKEMQTVVIPSDTKIYEGVTRGGNPKFWIEVSGISVSVSEGNAKKFKSGEVKLELVKWQNEDGKLRYSTRQVSTSTRGKGKTKDIDLVGLFK